jgi:diguanylate cyclase (GGDEF)-like protein
MKDEGHGVAAALNRVVENAGVVALVVGVASLAGAFFVPSIAWRIALLVMAAGAGVFFVVPLLRRGGTRQAEEETGDPSQAVSHPSEGAMKKLYFDDYQSSGDRYVVKEISDDAQGVVASSRKAERVETGYRAEELRDMDIPDFFDLDGDGSYSDSDPKAEFHSLANKVLLVLKDVLFAHSVVFFWANREKQQLVMESMATDSPALFGTKRFPIDRDLVSQVAQTAKPRVIGRINPVTEKELLRYYDHPAEVKSALAVPVFFMDKVRGIEPVGVIVADSVAEDAFGQESLDLLGRFTKLVSSMVKSYTDKYDLLLDAELLSSIRRMQDRIKSDPSEETILAALADEAYRLASWEYLTVTMYSDEHQGWSLAKVVNRPGLPYAAPDQRVDLHESIVGEAIARNTVVSLDDMAKEQRAYFHMNERCPRTGSFLCVPISSMNRCYGALTLHHSNVRHFGASEQQTVYRLVENAAAALEVVYMNALVREQVAADAMTGAFTRRHFLTMLEKEILRALEHGAELAAITIAVDGMEGQEARYGRDGRDVILRELVTIARAQMRPYDLVGRLEEDRIAVVLVGTAATDGYLWAEKVRKQIASHVMNVGSRSFSVTVSVGVCGLNDGMSTSDLITGTRHVLDKAIENGGNLVRVY